MLEKSHFENNYAMRHAALMPSRAWPEAFEMPGKTYEKSVKCKKTLGDSCASQVRCPTDSAALRHPGTTLCLKAIFRTFWLPPVKFRGGTGKMSEWMLWVRPTIKHLIYFLDWVLFHSHFTVRRFICVCVYLCFFCFILRSCIIVSTVGWT